MRDNEEVNEKPTTTVSLYGLICEFLAREGYGSVTLTEYQKTLDLICNPASPSDELNDEAVEYLIEKTAVNATTYLRWVLPYGSLRNFVDQYKGGRKVLLCRQKRMDYPTAMDIIALICQQPPAFR